MQRRLWFRAKTFGWGWKPARVAALLGLAALLPGAVLAQGGSLKQENQFEAYILTKTYLSYVEARLNEMEPPPLLTECPALKVVERETSWMVDDALFAAGAASPRAGRWIDRLNVERCGKRGTRNIFVTARGSELLSQPLIPGRTATSPQLQRETVRIAAAQARIKTGCKDEFHVVDTAIDGRFQPGAAWKEDWTLIGCKTALVIALSFAPDGRGGSAVTAKPK